MSLSILIILFNLIFINCIFPLSIFKLTQNYPNPFNPATMINFVIPQKSSVTLSVYDLSGKLVSQLINNEIRTEGSYSYEFDGSNLSSGLYMYRLSAGKYTETRKMLLLK